ncbi:MAG: general secretion pathway protein GspB [Rubrivivax sp.]|nr:general secretion pathway protein GspB [Rubrivivax sp.]
MSYVLDALRRAESERQRGSVPSLHAQSHAAPERRQATPAARPGRWAVVALGGLLLAAAAAWWWWPTPVRSPPPSPVVAAPEAAPTLRPLPAPPPVARPMAAVPRVSPPLATASAPVLATPAASATPGRVPRLQDLPEPLRRQIPALAFGGATDSPEPSARMLIINGQIWREGDELAIGLKLERIALRGAVFRFRDQRFEVAY